MKNNKGFSLVELIVVIAIMAILAAVAIPTFATFINKANVASDVSFINDIEYSAQLAHTATGDKVSNLTVKVNAAGKVTEVKYDILDTDKDNAKIATVTINDTDNNGTYTASVGSGENTDLAKDADAILDTIDWTYKFKSTKKAGSWAYVTADEEWKFTPNA